jgi:hypothetical protein
MYVFYGSCILPNCTFSLSYGDEVIPFSHFGIAWVQVFATTTKADQPFFILDKSTKLKLSAP